MNPFASLAKRPALLASCCLLGLFSIMATGCDTRKSSAPSGPTPREAELTKTVEELRAKLAAAEQAAEQSKAETAAALAQLKNSSAPETKSESAAGNASSTEPAIADTRYVVVKKTFNVGQLISTATGANPSATERRPAEYWVTFKGSQSGKEYPRLAVKESAYSQFREGLDYSPQDLNLAKLTVSANGTTSSPAQAPGNGSRLSEAEARSIFGNLTP